MYCDCFINTGLIVVIILIPVIIILIILLVVIGIGTIIVVRFIFIRLEDGYCFSSVILTRIAIGHKRGRRARKNSAGTRVVTCLCGFGVGSVSVVS